MSEKPNYQKMSTEELRVYVRHNDSEEAFEEYHSRLNWKTPPKFASEAEEKQWLEQMIAEKTA